MKLENIEMRISLSDIMSESSSVLFLGDVVPYKSFKFPNNLKTVINLECPIVKGGKPVSGKVNLSVPENYLGKIFGDNILAVNLANNHIMDYGVDGLKCTIDELEKGKISFFGINLPDDDSHNPIFIDHSGVKIGMLSFVSESTSPVIEFDDFDYLNLVGLADLATRIGEIRENVKRLIVYMHWGTQDSSYPEQSEIITARKMIEAGADIIIGTHSHAPQSIEKYKHGIIAYNLGNFIMPEFRNTPSFFDEDGNSLSALTRKLMVWNRVSWGLEIDMETMDFRVRKFFFVADRIIELKKTLFDRYIKVNDDVIDEKYSRLIKRHLKRRKLRRKIREMM